MNQLWQDVGYVLTHAFVELHRYLAQRPYGVVADRDLFWIEVARQDGDKLVNVGRQMLITRLCQIAQQRERALPDLGGNVLNASGW